MYTYGEWKKFLLAYGRLLNYLTDPWTLVNLFILLLSYVSVALYIHRAKLIDSRLALVMEEPDQHVSIYEVAFFDGLVIKFLGILIMLVMVNFVKLLRFHRQMIVLLMALQWLMGMLLQLALVLVTTVVMYIGISGLVMGSRCRDFSEVRLRMMILVSLASRRARYLQDACSEGDFFLVSIFMFFGSVILIMTIWLPMLQSMLNSGITSLHTIGAVFEEELDFAHFLWNRLLVTFGIGEMAVLEGREFDHGARDSRASSLLSMFSDLVEDETITAEEMATFIEEKIKLLASKTKEFAQDDVKQALQGLAGKTVLARDDVAKSLNELKGTAREEVAKALRELKDKTVEINQGGHDVKDALLSFKDKTKEFGGFAFKGLVDKAMMGKDFGGAALKGISEKAQIGKDFGGIALKGISEKAQLGKDLGGAALRGISEKAQIGKDFGGAALKGISEKAQLGKDFGGAALKGLGEKAQIGKDFGGAALKNLVDKTKLGKRSEKTEAIDQQWKETTEEKDKKHSTFFSVADTMASKFKRLYSNKVDVEKDPSDMYNVEHFDAENYEMDDILNEEDENEYLCEEEVQQTNVMKINVSQADRKYTADESGK